MSSTDKIQHEHDDDIVIQDLPSDLPETSWQHGIIKVQQRNWSSVRRAFPVLVVLSSLVLLIIIGSQVIGMSKPTTAVPTPDVQTPAELRYAEAFAVNDVVYIYSSGTQDTGYIEAVHAKDGKPFWHYSGKDITRVELDEGLLYLASPTQLVVLDASSRKLLWRSALHKEDVWQVARGLLFLETVQRLQVFSAQDGRLMWSNSGVGSLWQVDNDILYAQARIGQGIEALDVRTGQELWKRDGLSGSWQAYGGAIYINFADSHLLWVLNGRDGVLRWQRQMSGDFGFTTLNDVVCLNMASEQRVIALSSKDGRQLWQLNGSLGRVLPGEHLLTMTSPDEKATAVVNVSNGKVFWQYDAQGYIFLVTDTTGYVIRLRDDNGGGDITAIAVGDNRQLWHYDGIGHIAMMTNHELGIASQYDNTLTLIQQDSGQVLWRHPLLLAN